MTQNSVFYGMTMSMETMIHAFVVQIKRILKKHKFASLQTCVFLIKILTGMLKSLSICQSIF